MPRSRNAGSTVSGPSKSALVGPTRMGDKRTEPIDACGQPLPPGCATVPGYGDQRMAWERLKIRASLRLASAVSAGSRYLLDHGQRTTRKLADARQTSRSISNNSFRIAAPYKFVNAEPLHATNLDSAVGLSTGA